MPSLGDRLTNFLTTSPKNWFRPSDRHRAEYDDQGWFKDTVLGVRDAVVDRVAEDYRSEPFELEPDEGEYFLLKSDRREIALSASLEGTVGRGSDANWTVMAADLRREHARIETTDKGVVIEALEGAEVQLNGRPIKRALLQPGDHLRLGQFVDFEVELGQRELDIQQEQRQQRARPRSSEGRSRDPVREELEQLAQGGNRQDRQAETPSRSSGLASLTQKADRILSEQRRGLGEGGARQQKEPSEATGSRSAGPAGSVKDPGWWGRVRSRLMALEDRLQEASYRELQDEALELRSIEDEDRRQQAYRAWWSKAGDALLRAENSKEVSRQEELDERNRRFEEIGAPSDRDRSGSSLTR